MMLKDRLNGIIKKSILLSACKRVWFSAKWRKKNQHNFTTAKNCFHAESVTVGKDTYGELNVLQFGNPNERLVIGEYCSIAQQVHFLLGGEHSLDRVSTYPFQAKYGLTPYESICKGPIIVDDDVWLGYRSTILSGVHIGQGAVVAAGSVVTKDVPPYAIVGGVPAKVIRYRFPQEMIGELMKIDYSKLDKDLITEHIDELYQELTDEEQLKWLLQSL